MRQTRLAIAALLLFSSLAAHAVPIQITGTASSDGTWEITTVADSWTNVSAQLMTQEWWGDGALAGVFRDALGGALGFFDQGLGSLYGPLFAFGDANVWDAEAQSQGGGSVTLICFGVPECQNGTYGRVWAVARRVAVPEPGGLALLGIGLAALGLSRCRKVA